MVSDRDRGAVALLCLFAIVLAAAQFPATGLGSAPDGGGPIGTPPPTEVAASDGDTGGAGSGDSGDSGSSGDGDAATETETSSDTTTEPTTEPTTDTTTDDRIDVPTDERAVTDTPTPTRTRETTTTERSTPEPTTEETTEAPADDPDDGDESSEDLAGVLVGVLIIVGFIVVVGVVAASGGATTTERDRERSPRSGQGKDAAKLLGFLPTVAGGIAGAVGRLPRQTMGFVIGASRSAPRLFDAVGSATGQLVTGLGFAGSGAAKALGGAALKAPGGLVKGLGSLGGAAAGGLLSAPSGVGSLLGGILSDDKPGTDRPGTDARTAADVDPEEPSEPDLPPPPASVEEAWERMIAAAPVPDWQSKTPVEVARDAVRTGLPVEPVGRLTTLFRRVRYDPERPGDDVLSGAREALARIERPDPGAGDGGDPDE